jgi:general stress protein 26
MGYRALMTDSSTYSGSDGSTGGSDGNAKVHELIKGARIAMLTTLSTEGQLVSRPMAVQQVEFEGTVWFFAEADSPKIADIERDPRVNVAYSESNFVSLAGRASVVRDVAKKRELWDAGAAAWFGEKEPEDPSVVLIEVDAETAEYWDTPSRPATLVKVVKAKLTGSRPDAGETGLVEL